MVALRPAAPGDGAGPRHLKDALRRWAPTPAFGRAVLIVGVLLATAMLLGRVDLVVLAAPFAFGAALGIWRRPSRVPLVTVRVHQLGDHAADGGEVLGRQGGDELPDLTEVLGDEGILAVFEPPRSVQNVALGAHTRCSGFS